MSARGRLRRRLIAPLSVAVTLGVGGALLLGSGPVTAATGAGILVSAVAQGPQGYWIAPNLVMFRATAQMVESEVSVSRQGSTVVITEVEGGPSLGLTAPTDSGITCTASNPSGLSDEIRCTFGGDTAGQDLGVEAVFLDAPRAVTFGIDSASQLTAAMLGSPYDDYFQGGPGVDVVMGKAGNDFIFGGYGNDVLAGEEGDDVVYGDGEDGETGDDYLYGGPGADYLEGGPGADYIIGGPGRDDIDAKDGIADSEVDCNDPFSRGEESEAPRFDRGLDRPIDCGGVELPFPLSTPAVTFDDPVRPSSVLAGTAPDWGGTRPMTLSYRWESCVVSSTGSTNDCDERAKGTLNAQGRDARTGRAPSYVVQTQDNKRSMRFVVIADNSKVKGGGVEEVVSGLVEVGALTYRLPASLFPAKGSGSAWKIPSSAAVASTLRGSGIGEVLDVRETPWQRRAVPTQLSKSIKDGGVFSIRVNGKEVKAGDTINANEGARASVEIRYYSALEDRKTCPATDADIAAVRQQAQSGYVDFQAMQDFLDQRKCPWAVTWSTQTSPLNVFTVEDLAIEETDDPERPVQVRITARRPSTSPQLSIAIGAPPQRDVAQSPDQFAIGLAGAVYAFPGTTFTSIWTSLVGDQSRMPTKRARVQLFVNGELKVKGEQGANFSYNLATVFTEPGTARIVITTLADSGDPRAQVYVDIPILDPASAPLGDLITWDGRCFTRDGSATTCAGRLPNPNAEVIRGGLVRSGLGNLQTYPAVEALRRASADFNARFTPIVVNGVVPSHSGATRSSATPRSACAWWDVGCHLRGAVTQVVQAWMTPKPKPKAPIPSPQDYRLKSRVVYTADGGAMLVVTQGSVAHVLGAGLIGLDGATLIGLDGATLISDQGGSLIGLDGATLIGLDGATLIGLDGATLRPNQVALPLISAGGMN